MRKRSAVPVADDATRRDRDRTRLDGPGLPTYSSRWVPTGLAVAIVLMIVAVAVPLLFGWHVDSFHRVAPLAARWDPRIGPGTVPALLLGACAAIWGPRLAVSLPWGRLLAVAFAAGVAWMVSLATVDDWAGIGAVLNVHTEELVTARRVTSISAMLHEYISRIPLTSPRHWPTHVAGHPPGALLFFMLLVRLGLGSGFAAGWVIVLLAATTPVAVLLTLRRLGAEAAGRRIVPLLVIGPAAVWMAVSADAMFAAVTAWGLCVLAVAATAAPPRRIAGWGLLAGVSLGYCVMLSYGLALLIIPALAILYVARNPRPLPWAAAGAATVVLGFAAAGFAWWQAYPVLQMRYWAGVAHLRPAGYWLWGDLAALCFCGGPVIGACLATALHRVRNGHDFANLGASRPVALLALSAGLSIALADLSLMSKAEVERIWLPFVPWLLMGAATLPPPWLRRCLVLQIALALTVQTALRTRW